MQAWDYLARMWVEFQIGDIERSLENANKVLNLTAEGSDRFMIALDCKVYLEARLDQFIEAGQSFAHYQEQFTRKE